MKLKQISHAVKSAVQNKYAQAGAIAVIATTSVNAHAADLIPAGIFANILADLTDSMTTVNTNLAPVALTATVLGSVIYWIKRGGKQSVRG